jgi:DMSO/TMAO reductase YedYZ molybdopterin-dependent catalytic subunit
MQTSIIPRRRRFNTGFLAGLLAGIVATLLMLLLSLLGIGISLPEVFGSFFTQLLPPSAFNYLHTIIGGDAKHYLFYGILVGQCLVFAVSGGLWGLFANAASEITINGTPTSESHVDDPPTSKTPTRGISTLDRNENADPGEVSTSAEDVHVASELSANEQPGRPQGIAPTMEEQVSEESPYHRKGDPLWSPWPYSALLVAILWLLVGLVFLPLTGAGIFGASLTVGVAKTMFSLAVVGVLFGVLLVYLYNQFISRFITPALQPVSEEAQAERRAFIRNGLVGAGVVVLGVAAWRFINGGLDIFTSGVPAQILHSYKQKIIPPPRPNYGNFTPVSGLSTEITSNEQYYVVSKNLFADPVVNSQNWSLTVDGAVEKPYKLTYDELVALPMKQQYESMECISNEVGGPYMSSALWEGIPLVNLLQRAGGVKAGATKVVLYAVDDYSDSIHLSKALEPTTLVALHMNGQTLPTGHGYPARLLVPGIYGMKHVKWINRIEVTTQDYQGYWQQRGWSDEADLRLTSRIDVPLAGGTLKANIPTYIAGVAFSGNKGISEVDVSIDAGKTWQKATLKRPFSNLTWVLWELPWTPSKGTYTVVVRAIDMQGNVQDPQPAPPLPNGSSGYHTVSLTAS